MGKKGQNRMCYCAFCRGARKLPPPRHITKMQVAGSGAASLFLMQIFWFGFDARVFILFICWVGVLEMVAQIRWRMSLACRDCGFDPLLYLQKPHQAAEKVRAFVEKRRRNPRVLFSRRPVLDLPVRRVSKNPPPPPPVPARTAGSQLSKTV